MILYNPEKPGRILESAGEENHDVLKGSLLEGKKLPVLTIELSAFLKGLFSRTPESFQSTFPISGSGIPEGGRACRTGRCLPRPYFSALAVRYGRVRQRLVSVFTTVSFTELRRNLRFPELPSEYGHRGLVRCPGNRGLSRVFK